MLVSHDPIEAGRACPDGAASFVLIPAELCYWHKFQFIQGLKTAIA